MSSQELPDHATSQPEASPSHIELPPELVGLFGLEHFFGVQAAQPSDEYIAGAYKTNMPELVVRRRGKDGPIEPLPRRSRQIIETRARTLIDPPRSLEGNKAFTETDIVRVRAWVDGAAQGLGDDEVAQTLQVARGTVARLSRRTRTYLGTNSPISTMYSILLHGYRPEISLPAVSFDELSVNEGLHLYLGAVGFSQSEAAQLTGVEAQAVKSHRQGIFEKTGASDLVQVVARAFMDTGPDIQTGNSHFVSVSPEFE